MPARPTPASQFPQHPVRNPASSSSRVHVVRFHDSSGRMQNEPGSSSRVDEPDHAVIPGDVELQCEEFEVGANDETSNFQRVPDQPSDENPLVESQMPQASDDCHIHEDESLLNSFRKTCARDSRHRVFILFPLAWNLLVCRMNNGNSLVSKSATL